MFSDDDECDDTPKLRPTVVRKDCKVYKNILLMTQYNDPPMYIPPRNYPIENIDGYVRDMKLSAEREKRYRDLYTPKEEAIKSVHKTTYNVPSDPLTVFTNLKVLKNGTVKVKITVPMEPVYAYQQKGKLAPIDVRVRAAKGFGYPDEVLEKMIAKHDARKEQTKKLDEFIDAIFGKSINTKTAKAKVKTVHESLNSKFKKKPAKKYS